jgi:hypothetical protein
MEVLGSVSFDTFVLQNNIDKIEGLDIDSRRNEHDVL